MGVEDILKKHNRSSVKYEISLYLQMIKQTSTILFVESWV